MMVHSKEEILVWFRQQSASLRLETLCSLLECCVPCEIRFVGTVLENLGRRDFNDLRDAEHRANSFVSPNSSVEENRVLLLTSLMTDAASALPANGGISQPQGPFPTNQHHSHKTSNITAAVGSSSNLRGQIPKSNQETNDPFGGNRPSQIATGEKNWSAWVNEGNHPSSETTGDVGKTNKSSNLILSKNPTPIMNGVTSINPSKLIEHNLRATDQSPIPSSGDSEDDIESTSSSGEGGVLLNEKVRRRMILYLSLLTATNRDGANTFYQLLVSNEISRIGGYDRLHEHSLIELALLYTIAFYHPAFTFSQHCIISDMLMQIKFALHRREIGPIGASYFAQVVQSYDPKTGNVYYYQLPISVPPMSAAHMQHQQLLMQNHVPFPILSHPSSSTTEAPPEIVGNRNLQIPPTLSSGRPTSPGVAGTPIIVDTTGPSNQPYNYPSNFPVFMGQSPPNNNQLMQAATFSYHPHPTALNAVNAAQKPPPPAIMNENSDSWNAKKIKEKGVSAAPLVNGHVNETQALLQTNEYNQVTPGPRSRNISCFNCGSQTHYGQNCKESSMEDMTRHLYRLNFSGNAKAETS